MLGAARNRARSVSKAPFTYTLKQQRFHAISCNTFKENVDYLKNFQKIRTTKHRCTIRRGGFPRPPEQILILNKPNDEPQYRRGACALHPRKSKKFAQTKKRREQARALHRRGELRSPADGQGCPSLHANQFHSVLCAHTPPVTPAACQPPRRGGVKLFVDYSLPTTTFTKIS